MNVTYQFLKNNRVEGSSVLPFDQLVELINQRVAAARPHLRDVTLPTIDSQIVFRDKIPHDFGQLRALKVYSFGDEPWDGADEAQFWFVDRDGKWLWVKCDSMGGRQEYADVTAEHFAETRRVQGSPELAHIACLSTIGEAFRSKFTTAADSAREREAKLRTAAVEQAAFNNALRAVIY